MSGIHGACDSVAARDPGKNAGRVSEIEDEARHSPHVNVYNLLRISAFLAS